MSGDCTISFEESIFPPVKVPKEDNLSEHLNACNSPILFGCRSGLCGTCLIEVIEGDATPPSKDENEALEVYASGNPSARLACQIELSGPLKIRSLKNS